MATQKPPSQLDVLERMVTDALVQAGKALKSSRRDGLRVGSTGHMNRISEAHVTFNSALDDLESDLMKAKAVLQRDLNQLQAKRRPIMIPEPVMIPQASLAPMAAAPPTGVPEAPVVAAPAAAAATAASPAAPPAPMVGRSVSGSSFAPPGPATKPKQAAPFPNMGLEPLPTSPSPALGTAKAKAGTRSPQPGAALPGAQAAKNPVKSGSPALKTAASPASKSASPALKTAASPALKAGSPVIKSGSPSAKPAMPAAKAASATVKSGSPAVRSTPSPAVKTASPVPAPAKTTTTKATPPPGPRAAPPTTVKAAGPLATAPASVPIPTPVSVPTPQPVQPHAVGQQDQPLAVFDLDSMAGPQPGGAHVATNPELNFTDMQFSLAPANMNPQPLPQMQPAQTQTSQPQQGQPQQPGPPSDSDFDLTAFVADATNNIMSDSFGEHQGPDTASKALSSGAGGSGGGDSGGGDSGGDPRRIDVDTAMDDLLNLGGSSLEMELDSAGGAEGGNSFNEFFFDGAESSMGEFDNAYFGL